MTTLDPHPEPSAPAEPVTAAQPDRHRPDATDPTPHLLSENVVLALVRRLYKEAAKFGAVGIVSAIVDLGVFNALSITGQPLHTHPITARAISVLVATVVSYIGNRWWTWRDRERSSLAREYSLFIAINIVGLGINLGILALAEYGLGWHSGIERNLANLVGIGIGTIVRFFAYRRWVFMESLPSAAAEPVSDSAPASRP